MAPERVRAEDLLTPWSTDQFLDEVYGRRAALLGEPSDRFAGLLPWDSLRSALVHRRVEGLRLRVMRDERSVPVAEYTRTLPTRRGGDLTTLRAEAVADLLHNGATLAIDDVDEFAEPIAELVIEVERLFRESVSVNAYVSGGTTPGFAAHWDPHDVLAVQTMGRKTWRLYGPTREAPLVRDFTPAPAPRTPPRETHQLSAGQVLYLPRGWWHAVEATGEPSMHLAIGIRRRTGVDLVGWLADALREREEFRADLPRLHPDRHRSHMEALRRALDEVWDGDLLRRYLEQDESTAPVRRRLPLPDALPGQDLPFVPGDRVSLLAGRPVLARRGRDVTLAMDGQRWVFDGTLAPVIARLCEGGTHAIAKLTDCLTGLSAPEASNKIDNVLRRLLAAGLLRVVRAPR